MSVLRRRRSGCRDACFKRHPGDQQYRRYYKLCHGRIRAAAILSITIRCPDAKSSFAVRRTAKFTRWTGQERTLDSQVLMICDADKAIGIAGIMGGENSMITDDVKMSSLRQPVLTAQISAFLRRGSVSRRILPRSSTKDLIRTRPAKRLTEPGLWKSSVQEKLSEAASMFTIM